jgi:hypothetical protein
MSVVLSERMEHTQEYEALLTLFDTVRNHIEDVQGSSEKISELLEPCALEVSKDYKFGLKRGFASHGIFWLGRRDASQAFFEVLLHPEDCICIIQL